MKTRQLSSSKEDEKEQENGRRSAVVLHPLMHVTNFEPHAP